MKNYITSHQSKLLRYKSHADFLNKCLTEGIVPNGFKLQWEPQIDMDLETREKCAKVKKDASLRLITLTEKAITSKIIELQSNNVDIHNENSNHLQRSLYERKQNKLQKARMLNFDIRDINNSLDDFIVKNVAGDGNCFYRCIALDIYGSVEKHACIRDKIVDHMHNNTNLYSVYIDEDINIHITNQSHKDGRMSSWATEAEIYAAATVYSAVVQIYNVTNGVTQILNFEPVTKSTKIKRYFFLKMEHGHFDSLRVKSKQKVSHDRIEDTSQFDWFDMEQLPEKPHVKTVSHDEMVRIPKPSEVEHACFKDKKKVINKDNPHKDTDRDLVTKDQFSTIINLSSRDLTFNEKEILSKGLKFIPTTNKYDITKLQSDLCEWERRMRLKEYFHDKQNDQEKDNIKPWMKKKSRFTPTPGREKSLDTYIDAVKREILYGLKDRVQSNISDKESKALQSLLNDSSIIIRPADKGSGVVVVNTEDYIKNLEKEMNECDSYEKNNGKCKHEASRAVKKVANKLYRDGLIDQELKDYLIPKHPQEAKLKGNPKIHKNNNPYRTIVNGIRTATENMAEVAEKELNEFVETTPSYIKDTTDFLTKLQEIPNEIPENTMLFCFDVIKLYPSIPKQKGLEACREALDTRTDKTIPSKAIEEMITTVLDNNIITFNGTEYKQRKGVAIGSKLGRNFACAYMRKWDEELMKNEFIPIFYKRYIDDGFGFWTHGLEKLNEFLMFANQIDESIQVEMRVGGKEIEFLDTIVKIEDRKVITSLYTKPSDKHMYLNYKSSHPRKTKEAIPYSQAIRLKRICSKDTDYQVHKKKLKHYLRRRGYSGKIIDRQFDRADKLDRDTLLKPSEDKKKNMKRVPLVLTYSKKLPRIHDIVKKHLPLLHESNRMKEVFNEMPIVAYRRDKNIADILVHEKTNRTMTREVNPVERCTKKCVVCDMLTRGLHNRGGVSGVTISKRQTCEACNVIYGINCIQCGKIVYVGETSRSLKERLKEHEADTRHHRSKPVAEHFNSGQHSVEDMGVCVLQNIRDNSDYYRKIKELNWIQLLKTEVPNGLNTKAASDLVWQNYRR